MSGSLVWLFIFHIKACVMVTILIMTTIRVMILVSGVMILVSGIPLV